MGLTVSQHQLTEMHEAFLANSPILSPDADVSSAPKVLSLVGGGSTFCLLLSVRLANDKVETVCLNPVVVQNLSQLILIANGERGWWDKKGNYRRTPFSSRELKALTQLVRAKLPPIPGMAEFEAAPQVVSLFGGSFAGGMALNLRCADGVTKMWMLNPVIVFLLLGLIGTLVELANWWDSDGNPVLDTAN